MSGLIVMKSVRPVDVLLVTGICSTGTVLILLCCVTISSAIVAATAATSATAATC